MNSPAGHSLEKGALNRTQVVDLHNKYHNLQTVVENLDRKQKK